MSDSDTPKSRFDTISLLLPSPPPTLLPSPAAANSRFLRAPSYMSCFQALFTSPCECVRFVLVVELRLPCVICDILGNSVPKVPPRHHRQQPSAQSLSRFGRPPAGQKGKKTVLNLSLVLVKSPKRFPQMCHSQVHEFHAAFRAPLSFEGKSAQNSSLPTKLRFVSEKSGNNRPSSSEKQNQGTIQIL